MKSSAWDNRLWQDKMQELPIYADENSSWDEMRLLLDENMPVNVPAINPGQPFGPFGKKLAAIAGAVIVAALLYYAATRLFVVHEHKPSKNIPVVQKANRLNDGNNEPGNSRNNLPGTMADNTNNIKPANAPTNKTAPVKQHQAIKNSGNVVPVNAAAMTNTNSSANKNLAGNYDRHNNRKANREKFTANTNLGNAPIGHDTHEKPGNQPPANKTGYQIKVNSSLVPVTNGSSSAILSPQINNHDNTLIKASTTDSVSAAAKEIAIKTQIIAQYDMLAGKPGSGKTSRIKTAGLKGKPAPKKPGYTRFGININAGINTKTNYRGFLGLSGSYLITSKLSVGVGIQLLPSKVIAGNYSNHNYKYITAGDSGKTTINTAGNITVSNTVKIYSADVPVIFSYKLNNHFSITGGPVLSFPVNTDNLKNTLGVISKPADTTAAYKLISAAANNVTTNDRVRINLEGGIRINISRFYVDGAYIQGITPYSISTSLGSSKVYYHTFQFGIGYWIFKPKPKPRSK